MGNKGLDLCYHQGDINWAKVKAAGIDFIIPRDGWGIDCDGKGVDPKFIQNVKEAQAAGISVPGVYHFLYLHSMDDAIKNAQNAIANVQKAGLPKSTIIFLDQEEDTVIDAVKHGYNLTTDLQRQAAEKFCDYVLSQGYPTAIYLNKDYIVRVYGESILKKYDIWLADLSGGPDYPCLYQQTDWYARIEGIPTNVDVDIYRGNYTVGTAKPKTTTDTTNTPTNTTTETTNTTTNTTSKNGMKYSKDYVNIALKVLDRPQGLEYINRGPYNCGYCHNDLHLSGDCWCVNPKATVWSMYQNEPICDNYTPGKYYYTEGIKASGLPDVIGDDIMDNYCEQTTFRKMLEAKKAPCFLLINGNHMGAYIGEFERDGKIYNVTEFSSNPNLGGKMRSYVDECGQRITHKGGTVIGAWNRCGYLTSFLDYSDWNGSAPAPTPEVKGGLVDAYINALATYGDGRYHYWDGRPMGIGCSEYTRISLVKAGIISDSEYFHAASGIPGPLADTSRFQRLPWDANNLRRGDILWSNGHHVATWAGDGKQSLYEAAPEGTHPLAACGTGVGLHVGHGTYNCGTGGYTWTCIYRVIDKSSPTPEPTPTPTPTPVDLDITTLALEIYAGKWGNNPDRKRKVTEQYGEAVYNEAQEIVNKIVKRYNWFKTEVQIANDILSNKYGNNPVRQQTITSKYGSADAYRIAQGFVNQICEGEYNIKELITAIKVADEIMCGVHGNGSARRNSVVSKHGEIVFKLAQKFVNEILA